MTFLDSHSTCALGAALLCDGITLEELSPLRTQIELLDRYWERRVGGNDPRRFDRHAATRAICELMVERQALQVPTHLASAKCPSQAIDELLKQGVLSHGKRGIGRRSQEDWLGYSHHVLFDYAVARTLLRDDETSSSIG